MVDSSLGQHAVVCVVRQPLLLFLLRTAVVSRTLELGLAKRRGVAGDDDELGLARAQRLEGRLVAKSDLSRL